MVWKEVDTGTWVDDLDGAEKVFYNMSQAFKGLGKEHGSVYTVCKINVQGSGPKSPSEIILRNAWKLLRFEFPALSVMVEDSKKKYLVATADRVEQWAKETFIVETMLSVNEIVPTLHLRKLPCLIYLPSSSEIIFHASHWRIDALGACMILNRLFDLVTRCTEGYTIQQWSLEPQNLSPSLEDAFGSPKTYSPAMEAMAQSIRKRNFETSYPSAGLPYNGDITRKPAMSRNEATQFTVKSTKDLIASCREHKISVTAAIHAACAKTVFDRSKHNNHNYSTVVSANVREYLPVPQHKNTEASPAYSCGTYVTGITHTLRRADDYAARSSQLTEAYRGDWNVMEYMVALRPIYRVHGEALADVARPGTRTPASNVTVSSLGIIEKYLKSEHDGIVVEGFRLGSAIMTRQPTLYIWTFRNHLTISIDFNEAYYSTEVVRDLLKSVIDCLESELQITIEVGKGTE
ncbi:hypothetical protein F4819DRAFT_475059 [Hypoxylon fuscum]|nr:hypothetical protein F4819DRAFT_475059 [Hypoxylon fuscum]